MKHTQRALKHFHDSGVTIIFVEIAFNRREFEFTGCGLDGMLTNCEVLSPGAAGQQRHRHIQLRSKSELWLKENAINIGVQNLPHDWQQVCWLDSDVHFLRPNWVGECIHKLQHYSFLQMFSHARDLGPRYEMLPESYYHANGIGFVEAWKKGVILNDSVNPDVIKQDLFNIKKDLKQLTKDVLKLEHDLGEGYGKVGSKRVFPGLAWACTREAWEHVGGLMDEAIWGGQDWHASHSLIGKSDGMMWDGLHRNYQKLVMQWFHRCESKIRRNVGVMEGSITHHWHGRKALRGYNAKHALLARIGFDPPRHLRRDSNGLWDLYDDGSETFIQMRDMFRQIAKDRNEDSPEI